MYKGIFFCDVDGTILMHGHEAVSSSFFSVVREVAERGYLMCISSGRVISMLTPLFKEVEDLVIYSACNGCMIVHHGQELIPNHTVDRSHLHALVSTIIQWGAIPLVSTIGGLNLPKDIDHNTKSSHYATKGVTTFFGSTDELDEVVLQVTALCSGNVAEAIADMRQRWEQHYRITITGVQMFDICPTDKGESLRLVREHFNIPKERTWAFGDNENDIPMLGEAGAGYLMAGAHPSLHDGRFERCTDLEGMIRAIMDGH